MFISVTDTSDAAKVFPMQLTALRASVQHHSFIYLQVHWTCPLAPLKSFPFQKAESDKLDFTTAVFGDAEAAAQWAVMAKELEMLYHVRSHG